jgi:hypothetical protein
MVLWMAAFGLAFSVMPAEAAVLAPMTVTKVVKAVDPGSGDTASFGTAAWRSGSMTLVAGRLPDGRIDLRMHVKLVARRSFVAQLFLAGCEATVNNASLGDPAAYPPRALWTFRGPERTAVKQVRKGANDLTLSAVVSTDDRWRVGSPHWTDCATGGVVDQEETDKATIEEAPGVLLRQGTNAFASPPIVLTVTVNGQHFDACDGLGAGGWTDPASNREQGICMVPRLGAPAALA